MRSNCFSPNLLEEAKLRTMHIHQGVKVTLLLLPRRDDGRISPQVEKRPALRSLASRWHEKLTTFQQESMENFYICQSRFFFKILLPTKIRPKDWIQFVHRSRTLATMQALHCCLQTLLIQLSFQSFSSRVGPNSILYRIQIVESFRDG